MTRIVRLAAWLTLVLAPSLQAQTRIITGRVSDSLTNEAVTSGQVSVQGSTVGTSIKDDGTFTIAAPTRDIVLMFRSIGFKRKDVPVPANESSVTTSLGRDFFQLEAIVVTGQATGVERRNLANAVATVGAERLTKTPTATIEQSLNGKLAGIQVAGVTGAPGGSVMVRLRGTNSIIGNASPLYVIDGVIASNVAIPPGTNPVTLAAIAGELATTQEFPINRIADLNPNEIENIEVLKGASASAIYGSKASNGVILITTKRGRVGRPQFTVMQRLGFNTLFERHPMRNFANDSAGAAAAFPGAIAQWRPGAFFDHDRELADHKPLSYETSASVSGGTEDTRYYASGLVKHDGGIITRTYGDKHALHLNFDQQVGSRFSFGAGTEVTRTASDRGLTGNDNDGTSYYYVFPYTPSFVDLRGSCGGVRTTAARCSDGTVPAYPKNPSYNSNPLQTASLLQNEEVVWRALSSGKADLALIRGSQHSLRLLANGGVDFFNQRNRVFSPPELQFENDDGLPGTAVLSYSQNVNSNINANLVYVLKPGSGAFTATTSAGTQYERRALTVSRILARTLIGGLPIVSAGTSANVQEERQLVRDFGMFAQEEFLTLRDKLLLTVGIRGDQSSNNGDPKRIFWYPKGSASYRFPELMPGLVDELKLRAAVGASGNLPLWEQNRILMSTANIAGVGAYTLQTQAGAPNVVPERQLEIEAGVDATLLKGRGNLEFTFYNKRIADLLLSRSLQPSQGFRSIIFNQPQGAVMTTRGIETGLTVIPVQSKSIQWSLHGDLALSRCTIDSLPVPAFATSGVFLEQGKPCRQATGRDTLASLADTMRIANVAARSLGTRTIGSSVNPMIRGDATPRYQTNLSSDFTFKAVRLYFLWFFHKGGFINDRTLVEYDLGRNTPDYGDPCTAANCLPGETLGAWRVRMNTTKTSRVYTQDNTYWKLREAALTFDAPRSVVQRFFSGARYLRLGLSGRNLLTFTKCTCDEPEQGTVATIYGAASNAWKYPTSRSFYFTVDVGF